MDTARAQIALRSPDVAMRLERLGSFHPTRLSFMRVLLRRLAADHWQADRPVWAIDQTGVGHAVYRIKGPERTYSLVAFAHDLPDDQRSDRVIAEAWDATFALIDGEPTDADIQRLLANVPLQEAGRMTGGELTLSRANRSVRLFNHVVDRLATGVQPDQGLIDQVGYLMRTTAVYGSGKFGLADRASIADRPELTLPFQAEMLTVWLIRAFTIDIVQHLARARGGARAVRLDRRLARSLGVGNSTGLGMAPFLISHPVLIHHWMQTRETALALVRAEPIRPETLDAVRALTQRAILNVQAWGSDHDLQRRKLAALQTDLGALQRMLADVRPQGTWDQVWTWAESALGTEGQEQLLSLLLEPHGALIDHLAQGLCADEAASFAIKGDMAVDTLIKTIRRDYAWALGTDWGQPESCARLWYTSIEKLEPRLAERADEPLEPYEQPLAPGRAVAALFKDLQAWEDGPALSDFLTQNPHHRHAVRRVQQVADHPFAEVHDNTISEKLLPIDMLRAKLSFFGASRFDPRSDRWVRVNMFQNAPFPDEPDLWAEDDWMLPA